jgi:hypothetical protein
VRTKYSALHIGHVICQKPKFRKITVGPDPDPEYCKNVGPVIQQLEKMRSQVISLLIEQSPY